MEFDKEHSGLLLASFNEMRKADVMCDFTVKVGNQSFNVHSVVLAAASKYFTAMFSSKMKEVKEEFVDMKSLNAVGVRRCIEYIYSGGVNLNNDSVEETLKASDLIQLDGLTAICFKFMKNNLSVKTCLSTLNLSGLHSRDDVKIIAEKYVLENFEAVTLTEMFPLISKSDLLHYIKASKTPYIVTWQAVMRWFSIAREESGKVLLEIVKSINLPQFPFQFLLKIVLNDSMIKENNSCNKLVIDSLFEDVEKMKRNLSTETFFVVKNLTKSHEIQNHEKVNKIVVEFLAENFENLMKEEGFCNLEKDEIVSLFQSPKINCSSEKTKWDAAIKWTKHDQRRRKKVFGKIFKSINLELLPSAFLHQTVRNETLVKESRECTDIILDYAFASGGRESKKDRQTLVSHIACLDVHNGNIKALDLTTNQWNDLPNVKLTPGFLCQRQIINVDDEIYCLNNKNVLMLNQNQMKWIQTQSRVKKLSMYVQAVAFKKRIYVVDCDVLLYYVAINDVWQGNLPGCGLGMYFYAAASDKFIYAMGGWKNRKYIDEAKRFDPKTQSWSSIARLNTGRYGASAAVLNNIVYVIGGEYKERNLNSVEVFHENSETWTTISNLCVARSFPSSCVANNKLYVVGGTWSPSIESYEGKKWKIVKEYECGEINFCCVVNLCCDKD